MNPLPVETITAVVAVTKENVHVALTQVVTMIDTGEEAALMALHADTADVNEKGSTLVTTIAGVDTAAAAGDTAAEEDTMTTGATTMADHLAAAVAAAVA